jgi:hypothetical protein
MPGSGGVDRHRHLEAVRRRARTLTVAWVTLLASLPAAFGRSPAPLKPTPVKLVYRRGPGAERCPGEAELKRRVSALLGNDPFRQQTGRTLHFTLTTRGKGFHGHLELREHGRRLGVREIEAEGPGCQALADAAALSMALAIDPLATRPKPPPPEPLSELPPAELPPAVLPPAVLAPLALSPPPPVERTPTPAREERPPDAGTPMRAEHDAGPAPVSPIVLAGAGPAPLPPIVADAGPLAQEPAAEDAGVAGLVIPEDGGVIASERPRIILSAGAGWMHGLQPSDSVVSRVGAGLRWPHTSIALEGALLPSVSLSFQGGRVAASSRTVGVVPCLHAGQWGGCALLEVAALTGTGSGYAVSSSHTTWMPRLGLRAQWEWVFAAPVGLRLYLDGAANLVRPRLLVDEHSAWQAPALSISAGGALLLSF